MKRSFRSTFVLITVTSLVLLLLGLTPLTSFAGQEFKHVFVLNSFNRGYSWTDNMLQGIDDAFGSSGIKVETYVTFMDMKRIPPTPQYFQQIKELIREGYKGVRFDAVLACDNDAFEFTKKYRDELFPGVPVVFSSINDFDERMLEGRRDITGTSENTDYTGTIKTALKLFPTTNNILVVTDNTTTGKAHRSAVEKIRLDFPQNLGFTYVSLADLTMDELAEKLSKLGRGSIVLLLQHFKDKNGTSYTVQQSTPLLTKSSSVPVFVLTDSRMGLGALGGHVVSGYHHGEAAAQMVVKILKGTDVKSIPVLLDSPNKYMFDYGIMQRLNIAEKDLPQGSILINRPLSLLDKYRPYLYAILGAFILLSGFIAYLLREISRRKKIEAALQVASDKLQEQNEELQMNEEELRSQNQELLSSEEMLRVQINEYEASQKLLKEREESLSRQNGLFSSLLKILPIGVFMVEAPSGKPLVANETAFKLLGRGILPDASRHNLAEAYKAFKIGSREPYPPEEMPILLGMNGVSSHIDDLEVERPDGTKTLLEIFGSPVADEHGHIWASLVSFIDITQRKQAEEVLRKSEERHRSILNSAMDGFWLVNKQGQLQDVNESYSRMSGYSMQELLTKSIADFDVRESDDDTVAHNQMIMKQGEDRFESQHRRKDGTIFDVEVSAKYVLADGGLLVGFLRDITERKRMEEALWNEKAFLRSLIDSATDLIYFKDCNGIYLGCNKASETFTGLAEQKQVGKSDFDFFDHEMAEQIALRDQQVLEGGVAVRTEEWVTSATSSRVLLDTVKAPIYGQDGQPIGLVGISRDITERKRIEEAIQKRIIALTQPLESSTISFEELFNIDDVQQLQDEFARATGVASIITHPDGTPLTTPSNFTRLCNDIIRKSEKGCVACHKSDAVLGRYNPDGPSIQTCLSGGLWDAGAGITVGGQHIANWLIGQVRNETQSEDKMVAYAREIGVDETTFLDAFREVPSMSQNRFEQVAQALFTLANQLSTTAYQNIQQARFINERKLAEDELHESEEKLRKLANEQRLILTSSSVGISLLKDRKVQWANPAFDAIFGYEAGTTVTMDTVNFYPDRESYTVMGQEAYSILASGEPYSADMNMKRKDGSQIWCNLVGRAVNPDNPEEGSIWVVLDITDRKQAEEQVFALAQRLQLATSSAHMGIWDWNVRDNQMVWDDRMFELYGISPDTFPSNIDAWMNGLHPEDKETAIAECQASLRGEQDFDTTFRVLHPDGTILYIHANGLVIRGGDGTAERMIGINVDITGMKHSEDERVILASQLQQAQKMESVGRLAGGVAHDFNNMLTVILGHSELALMRLDPDNPVSADLQEISNAAERSADLTRQLLAFARKQTISPKILDLNDAVTSMFKMIQRLIGEDIHLTWQPAPELWQIKMDPSQIDQILANLCVNARDAIEGNGRISIVTENQTIDKDYCTANLEAAPGEYVRLTVSDDGRGMDKATAAHIFEPFFTTKELGKGTGLGLATVYGAVKQNNGFINIYSELEHGTTFSIYLPRYDAKIEQKQTEEITKPLMRGQETILLVEDELTILKLAETMLVNLGYTVLKASTPVEALQIAQEQTGEIHILLSDVIMPEMSGRELADKLFSIYPRMKQLFMSGYSADIIAHHGVLDEGVHFIQKPFSVPNLAAKVREVLDNK